MFSQYLINLKDRAIKMVDRIQLKFNCGRATQQPRLLHEWAGSCPFAGSDLGEGNQDYSFETPTKEGPPQ
ncbi:unnamed protein product, partial [Iphiclides podalirius]